MSDPDYRAFARDMMKLCKRHGVCMKAADEGYVYLGAITDKKAKDCKYHKFQFSPIRAVLGNETDDDMISITASEEG